MATATRLGIDASIWQGSGGMPEARFRRLAAAGITFGVFRATFGGALDRSWSRNVKRSRAAGIMPGAYAFLTGSDDGRDQATVFHRIVRKELAAGLLVWLDVESNPSGPDAEVRDVVRWLKRWRELAGDHPVMIYTSRGYWLSLGNPDVAELADGVALAYWTQRRTDAAADLPDRAPRPRMGGWSRATFWQYGTWRGSGGPIDGDAFYGTAAELRAVAGKRAPALEDRPGYRKGYAAALAELHALVARSTPAGDAGPAFRAGWGEAIADALADLEDLTVDDAGPAIADA